MVAVTRTRAKDGSGETDAATGGEGRWRVVLERRLFGKGLSARSSIGPGRRVKMDGRDLAVIL